MRVFEPHLTFLLHRANISLFSKELGMSNLVSRILLAIFMFPLASLVYITAVVVLERTVQGLPYRTEDLLCTLAGVVTWVFIILYWLLLWRRSVQWATWRRVMTLAAGAAALVAGLLLGMGVNMMVMGFGSFLGSVSGPLLWLLSTVLIWRESSTERAQRLKGAGTYTLACPVCGYNLTGLSEARCPECGARFTLTDLLASQKSHELTELE